MWFTDLFKSSRERAKSLQHSRRDYPATRTACTEDATLVPLVATLARQAGGAPLRRAAFEEGAVDAWVIWEPYRTAAEMSLGARTVADGTGLVSNHEFFFVAKPFAESHPQVIDVVLGAARDIYAEAVKDIPGTARTFSAAAGFPAPVLEVALSRRGFGVQPLSDQVIAEQQKIADTFKELGLIPAAIKVSDAVRR